MAKDLSWLEQKTNVFENPAEKRLEELRNICILNDINNPIIGEELYDPKKPDTTRPVVEFRDEMRKKADNLDIYRNYKKDRRNVFGECEMKGEKFEIAQLEKREIFILDMRCKVFGRESMTKKELKQLKNAGKVAMSVTRLELIQQVQQKLKDEEGKDANNSKASPSATHLNTINS